MQNHKTNSENIKQEIDKAQNILLISHQKPDGDTIGSNLALMAYLKKDPSKKIDVFLKEKKIATIGDINLLDYPSFIEERGLNYANKRRDAYYSRFKRLPDIKDGEITPMFWSRYLLW